MTEPASPSARPAAGDQLSGNLRGAIDLSALQRSSPAGDGAPGAAGGQQSFAVDATEATFPELVQLSSEVPVVVSMFASWSPQSQSVTGTLERW